MLLIIGLGVTQLLSKLVNRIRRRHEVKLHWIPLAWAIFVFLYQMEFLWSAFGWNSLIKTWTPSTFLLLLVYALLLFLAGVLVSPRPSVEKNHHAFNSFLKTIRVRERRARATPTPENISANCCSFVRLCGNNESKKYAPANIAMSHPSVL